MVVELAVMVICLLSVLTLKQKEDSHLDEKHVSTTLYNNILDLVKPKAATRKVKNSDQM